MCLLEIKNTLIGYHAVCGNALCASKITQNYSTSIVSRIHREIAICETLSLSLFFLYQPFFLFLSLSVGAVRQFTWNI